MTNKENINSFNEFEEWVKDRLKIYWKDLKEPHNSFLWKVLKEVNEYREMFYSEQRERDFNAQEEQKEIESTAK